MLIDIIYFYYIFIKIANTKYVLFLFVKEKQQWTIENCITIKKYCIYYRNIAICNDIFKYFWPCKITIINCFIKKKIIKIIIIIN